MCSLAVVRMAGPLPTDSSSKLALVVEVKTLKYNS